MADAELVHELLDERRTLIAHELLPAPELGAAGAPVEAPVAEGVDDRKRLDAGFGEAVASALPAGGGAAGEDPRIDEPHEAVGEDVRGDALDRPGEQRPEVAAVAEDDVAQHEQRPAISEHLDGGVDRAPGPWFHDSSLTGIFALTIVVAERNHYREEEMMGRFVYWMNVSLDLRIEQVPGDNGAGEWLRIDEELHREFNAQARALALMVQGRVIYETMEEYWPRAREDASLPDVMREYGEIWTAKPKVLVSRTRHSADHNTRIIGGDDAIEQLAALRAGTDGAIGVGGAALATQLLRAGLLDELLLFTHPAILGFGRPLFDDYDMPIDLDLLEQRSFDQGVTMHRYAIRDEKEVEPVLRQVAEGVLVHESEFCQSNAVVVQGRDGVLLIDPGVLGSELACLANDLSDSGQTVVAGFSTHPHWDHLLWHASFGAAPRYGTARCAARIQDLLSAADWKTRIAPMIPPDIAEPGTAGPDGPHYRPARGDGADPVGRPSGPDYRASSACPGPCGAADRGPRGSRRRRHAVRCPDSDARPDGHRRPDRGLPRRAATARGRGGRRRCRRPRPRVRRRS